LATLTITEFGDSGTNRIPVGLPIAQLPAISTQQVTVAGASAQSAAFSADTRFVRLRTDTACRIVAGDNPTATTSDLSLDANQAEYFGVTPGQKLAVIAGA